MRNPERFAFVAGVLGFIVDLIALGTFVASGWGSTEVRSGSGGVFALQIWGALVLIYGWFIVTWFLVRRNYHRYQALPRDKRPRSRLGSTIPKKWRLDMVTLRT